MKFRHIAMISNYIIPINFGEVKDLKLITKQDMINAENCIVDNPLIIYRKEWIFILFKANGIIILRTTHYLREYVEVRK